MTDTLRDQLQATLGSAYTLERELGGGGMSRVFLAREEALGRQVVVKILAPQLWQGLSAERFTREIRFAASLQEPHIVPVLTAGSTGDGTPFYTMPYVRGESLRARMAGSRVPLAESISILRDLARALAYAHRQGVAHRDIKPENVLLSEGTAVVTDFGIAKAVVAARTQEMSISELAATDALTEVGISLGTPAYMAPEQAAGESVDHRADLYSWGVLAYELLAGQHPFDGRRTAAQWMSAHLTEPPPAAPLQQAEVPPAITALVLQALEKDCDARPQSAGDILARLDAALSPAGGTPASRELGDSRRAEQTAIAGVVPATRRKWWIAGALVTATAVATIAAFRQRGEGLADTAAIESLAVLPFQNIGTDSADAYLALGITDQLAVTLGRLPSLRIAPRVSSQVLASQGRTASEIAAALNVRAVLTGTVRRGGNRLRVAAELVDARSRARVWSDEFEEQQGDVFAVEDRVTRAIVDALRARLSSGTTLAVPAVARGTSNREAYDLYIRGRYFWTQRSEVGIGKAIDYFHRAIALDPSYVAAISGLADAYGVSGFYSYVPPEEGFGQAKAMSERAMSLDSTRAEAHASRGYVALYYDWDWPRADREFRRAIALDSTYATAHQWLGNYLVAMGRRDESVAELGRAEQLDPLNRISVGAKCWGMVLGRLYADAIPQCDRALDLDSTFALAHTWKGEALALSGDEAGAEREHAAAIRLSGRSVVTVAALARSHARANKKQDARALLEELQSPRQRYIPSYEIAEVYANLGEAAQALTWLERAHRERSHSIAFLKVDPWLDPVRGEARFKALLEGVGLE